MRRASGNGSNEVEDSQSVEQGFGDERRNEDVFLVLTAIGTALGAMGVHPGGAEAIQSGNTVVDVVAIAETTPVFRFNLPAELGRGRAPHLNQRVRLDRKSVV